jgi:hypothetical protein
MCSDISGSGILIKQFLNQIPIMPCEMLMWFSHSHCSFLSCEDINYLSMFDFTMAIFKMAVHHSTRFWKGAALETLLPEIPELHKLR